MKKFLAFVLAAMMLMAFAVPVLAEGETFLWDNFDDRDPKTGAKLSTCGLWKAFSSAST